jgi:hypothetical protein
MGKSYKKLLILILLLSLGLRIGFLLKNLSVANEIVGPDGYSYYTLALSIKKNFQFMDMKRPCGWRMPLYPLFLAGVIALFGEGKIWLIRIV